MVGVGACAAAAFGSVFVAPSTLAPSAQKSQEANLKASGYSVSASQPSTVVTRAGAGVIAGLATAGVAGKRASVSRTSMWAMGVGIIGFGQTCQYPRLISLLGVKQVCVGANKMDCGTAGYEQTR